MRASATVPTILPQKHVALGHFFVQELVEEGKTSVHYVTSEDHLADLGTKHHSKHRYCDHIKLINEFGLERQQAHEIPG